MKNQFSRYYVYIKPVLRNKGVKTYSSFVFSLLTTLFFVFFTIRPTISTIVSLQNSIKEQNQVLEQLNTKTETLTLGKKNYEALGSEVQQKIKDLLPETAALPNLLDDLYALAISHEASVSGIQLEPSQLEQRNKELSKDAVVTDLAFTINAQGTYDDLLELLSAINQSSRLISIDSITLSKQQDANAGRGFVVVSINAKAFYLKNPNASQTNTGNQTSPGATGGDAGATTTTAIPTGGGTN